MPVTCGKAEHGMDKDEVEDNGKKYDNAEDGKMMETQDEKATLTNRQGHPIYNNQSSRTVGNRGPMTMENYPFIEKITHFDRERIPERVVHARGAGAHGYFEAYGTVGDEPIAKLPNVAERLNHDAAAI